jgi:thiamine-phosphate pyrophosphorylase
VTSKQPIDFRLYLITDRKLVTRYSLLVTAVEEALKGGVKAVQLREKDLPIRELLDMAYRMRETTSRYSAKLFINDRVDIAMAVGADGVHLGQKSMPAYAAKKASKGKLVAGVSTHSIAEAIEAEEDGADFITFGPVYPTPSKLKYGEPVGTDALNKVCNAVSIPVFAISGIKTENIKSVLDSGADGVAVISAILGSADIKHTTEQFMRYFQ